MRFKLIKRKALEQITFRLNRLLHERVFIYQGVHMKYIFLKSKQAVGNAVILSAYSPRGIKAKYNYVRTLEEFPLNRLYILDDFGDDKRGSYYLGKYPGFLEEKAVLELIKNTLMPDKNKMIFLGSSKGGYAAINFGLRFKNAYIISGAPQYYLRKYLQEHNPDTLNYIIGSNGEGIEELDCRLKSLINKNKNNQHIFLHFSIKEHTYLEHIVDLINDLKNQGYEIYYDVKEYEEHGEVANYFPEVIKRQIREILASK